MPIATSQLLREKNEPFLDRIITGDEKWITYENIICKRQWLERINHPYQIRKLILIKKLFYIVYRKIVEDHVRGPSC